MAKRIVMGLVPVLLLLSPVPAYAFFDVVAHLGLALVGNIDVIGKHKRDCAKVFRSYNSRTDTYIGLDGKRHRCKLRYK